MKMAIYLGVFVGGTIGSYLPVAAFQASWFSVASIVGGFVGSVAGVWLGWKLAEWIDS